jgi:hypothetical protein
LTDAPSFAHNESSPIISGELRNNIKKTMTFILAAVLFIGLLP